MQSTSSKTQKLSISPLTPLAENGIGVTGIVEFYDRYSPNGRWDESVLIEKNDLEANLLKVEEELQKIAQKLGAKK